MIRPSTLIKHSPDRTPGSSGWRDLAACKDQPGAWDYDATPEEHAEALEICWNVCPVQQQCADYAKANRPDGGVWGGEVKPNKTAGGRKECVRGHDTTDPSSRYANYGCRQCSNDRDRSGKKKKGAA